MTEPKAIDKTSPSRVEFLCMMNSCIAYGFIVAGLLNEPVSVDTLQPWKDRFFSAARLFARSHDFDTFEDNESDIEFWFSPEDSIIRIGYHGNDELLELLNQSGVPR